jgi:hypothetical protein
VVIGRITLYTLHGLNELYGTIYKVQYLWFKWYSYFFQKTCSKSNKHKTEYKNFMELKNHSFWQVETGNDSWLPFMPFNLTSFHIHKKQRTWIILLPQNVIHSIMPNSSPKHTIQYYPMIKDQTFIVGKSKRFGLSCLSVLSNALTCDLHSRPI